MMFRGRWIRHCTDYPAWQARFVRAPGFEFVQAGHGQRESPRMRMGRIAAGYEHLVMPGAEEDWLRKHRGYARAEAAAARPGPQPRLRELFFRGSLARRRALKRLGSLLPCRPAARFLYQYVLRGGFLDGAPGLRYCVLLARYEGFIAEESARAKKVAGAGALPSP
jgi:hypothetical protein